MKRIILLTFVFVLAGIQLAQTQNITVSSNNYTDQQLIEDVLFGTNCVENIVVGNTVSGNFSNGELSYGYFNANNSDFPFSEGLALSTGRLSSVPGPNSSISDDDAAGWIGDQDLEDALGTNSSINATIFEFSFVPQASSINFRYLFASEEYRENNPFTCDFSDAFAFLIRPAGTQSYENLALVPGTNTPVLVTTVRPEIPGECDAINEEYFGQFNTIVSPINFNGQTAILTAETDVIAGQTYEVKLVIADETNYRYDSAVFIEADSFNVGVNLGQNQILCDGEILNLEVNNDEAIAIRWYYEEQLINSIDDNINVSQNNFGSGLYTVEVDLPSGCTAIDEIELNYASIAFPENLSITTCVDNSGFGIYNLFDISTEIDSSLQILNFYTNESDAENNMNPIQNANSFQNSEINQIVFFEVLNANNCIGITSVQLDAESQVFEDFKVTVCPVNETSPTTFPPAQAIKIQIGDFYGIQGTNVDFYNSIDDAVNQSEEVIEGLFQIETDLLPLTLYARLTDQASCLGLVPVILQRFSSPQFLDVSLDYSICENSSDSVTLDASLIDPTGEIIYEWSNGELTETITVEEPGDFSVEVTRIQNIDGQEVVCVNSKNFNVVASSIPEVSYTQTGFVSIENELIITAEGSGVYEYALNNSGYVDTNIFSVEETTNTLFVRDKNGCGTVSVDFVALKIPAFFTPNGDGFNDYWQIEGVRQNENDIQTIYIFDRYGKLIFESSPELIGWDGTYNGAPVPATDYWYKIQLNSGKSLSGHLTLKR